MQFESKRNCLIFGFVVVLLSLASMAQAQWAVGPQIVISVPRGEFADVTKTGEGFGVKASYDVPGLPVLSFRGDLKYLSYSSRISGSYYVSRSVREEAFRLVVGPQVVLPVGMFKLYAAGLAGIYHFRDVDALVDYWGYGVSDTKTRTKPEWSVGGGVLVDIGLGPWIDVDIRYHTISEIVVTTVDGTTTESDGNDISVGVGVVFFLGR